MDKKVVAYLENVQISVGLIFKMLSQAYGKEIAKFTDEELSKMIEDKAIMLLKISANIMRKLDKGE